MMNTFSLLPKKTAQPSFVGRTARTCACTTVLFMTFSVPTSEEKTSRAPGEH